MMRATSTTFLFAGVALAQVRVSNTASSQRTNTQQFPGGWPGAPTFLTPSNSDNSCSSQEQQGYTFANFPSGSFSSFDGSSFTGFQCSNSFGKRDSLTKRAFPAKVIQGQLSESSGPSISCGEERDFSISEYQVSVSTDTDVVFHYQMNDGSTCQHTTACSSGGTVVQNTQCGGAQQVSFQLPQGSKSSYSIGIHSIGFDCSPPASSVHPSSVRASSRPIPSPATSVPARHTPVRSFPTPSPSYSPPRNSSWSCAYGRDCSPWTSSPLVVHSPSSPVAPASPTHPAPSRPSAQCPDILPQCLNTWMYQTGCKDNSNFECYCEQADYTKNVIECVTAHGASSTEIQEALSYLIGICAAFVPKNPGLITNCPSSIPFTSASPSPQSPTSSTPVSPATSVTEVVYTTVTVCPPGQTVTHAGQTTVLTAASVSTIYVTSTSTVCPQCAGGPSTPASPVTTVPAVPMTTITIAQSYTVPCTYSTGVSAGYPIPSSSTITTLSTAVTVPQVQFTTASPVTGSTISIGLVPGPAPSVPAGGAQTTPVQGTATATYATYSNSWTASGWGTTYVPTKPTSGGITLQTVNAARRVGAGSGSVVGLLAGVAMLAL
jgi:hypothetical protein